MAARGLTGILLVGGASRRFGSPKAIASFDGETLAERGWRTLATVSDERIAVGKQADDLGLPFDVLDDGSDVRAPIAGVVAGLRAASRDRCVFLPVDTPLVRPEHLYALADAGGDVAVPQTGPLPVHMPVPYFPSSNAVCTQESLRSETRLRPSTRGSSTSILSCSRT